MIFNLWVNGVKLILDEEKSYFIETVDGVDPYNMNYKHYRWVYMFTKHEFYFFIYRLL